MLNDGKFSMFSSTTTMQLTTDILICKYYIYTTLSFMPRKLNKWNLTEQLIWHNKIYRTFSEKLSSLQAKHIKYRIWHSIRNRIHIIQFNVTYQGNSNDFLSNNNWTWCLRPWVSTKSGGLFFTKEKVLFFTG